MPVLIVDVSEVETTVDRNIFDSVIKNVLASTGLTEADVIINDVHGGIHQPGSTVGEERDVSFGNSERVYVDVETSRNRNTRINRAVGRDYSVPFFHDTDYNIKLSPSMVSYDLTLTIRRQSASKVEINKWLNDIQRRIDMGGSVLVTEADFHYLIPAPLLNLVAACYSTIYYGRTPAETLLEYFKRNFSAAVTTVTNVIGADPVFAVRNKQVRLVGQYDDSEVKVSESDNNISWIGELRFSVSYDRPETVTAMFPVSLRCTLLPAEWWPSMEAPGLGEYTAVTRDVYVGFGDELIANKPMLMVPFILPECDMPSLFMPRDTNGYRALIVAYLEFVEAELTSPQLLFNLTELGDLVLTPIVMDYIAVSYSINANGADSLVKIFLYENDAIVQPRLVTVDATFNVWYHGDIDIEKIYRAVLAIDVNLTWLSDASFDFLRRSPDFVRSILSDFNPEYVDSLLSTANGGLLAAWLRELQEQLAAKNKFDDDGFGMKTILNGRLLTHRGE